MKRAWLGIAALAAIALAPSRADAFCGFYVAPGDKPLYNDASMVSLMRDGTRTVMSMSNNYKGPAADFAMVVPVPVILQKENVKTLDKAVFTKLEQLTAPRLVEYWEQDPCNLDEGKYAPVTKSAPAKAGGAIPPPKPDASYGVTIEAKFAVGEYQILILSAKESDGLEKWLLANKYNIPKGASAALAPYIKEQQKFFVAKIDIQKVKLDAQGVAVLSPLRFSYESPDFRLPVRLGLLNAQSKQDLIVYTLSKTSRYDVANYPNAFIPTNLEVTDATRNAFGPFYAALFDEAVNKGQGKAIVTEYSWASSSCDPCPTPPLSMNEIAVLGGDVLFGMGVPPPSPPMPPGGPPKPMPGKGPMPKPGFGWGGGFVPMVLTRMHARYDQSSLGDDLVFRAAAPVVGGREHVINEKGEIEKGAQLSSMNNFQARYIIRHPWTGPIKCQNPQRNVWGGPPGSYAPPKPTPATGIAGVPRGAIKLTTYLKKGMPSFEITAAGTVLPAVTPIAPPDVDAGPPPGSDLDAAPLAEDVGTPQTIAPPAGSSTVAPVEPKPKSGCGCDVPGRDQGAMIGATFALALAGGALARRRRR